VGSKEQVCFLKTAEGSGSRVEKAERTEVNNRDERVNDGRRDISAEQQPCGGV